MRWTAVRSFRINHFWLEFRVGILRGAEQNLDGRDSSIARLDHVAVLIFKIVLRRAPPFKICDRGKVLTDALCPYYFISQLIFGRRGRARLVLISYGPISRDDKCYVEGWYWWYVEENSETCVGCDELLGRACVSHVTMNGVGHNGQR